jgi:hypothetical protein
VPLEVHVRIEEADALAVVGDQADERSSELAQAVCEELSVPGAIRIETGATCLRARASDRVRRSKSPWHVHCETCTGSPSTTASWRWHVTGQRTDSCAAE